MVFKKTVLVFSTLMAFLAAGFSQEVKLLQSEKLIQIADAYGIDSALSITPTHVWLLDSSVSVNLAKRCTNIPHSDLQHEFFLNVGVEKHADFLSPGALRFAKFWTRNYARISDQYFRVFIFQKDKSTIPALDSCLSVWRTISDSLKSSIPQGALASIRRFFNGDSREQKRYWDCQANRFGLAYTMDVMGLGEKYQKEMDAIKPTLEPYLLQKQPGEWFRKKSDENFVPFYDTIQLRGKYASINEIKLDFEIALATRLNRKGPPFFTDLLVTNGKLGIYMSEYTNQSCLRGQTWLIELLEGNKIRIRRIEA